MKKMIPIFLAFTILSGCNLVQDADKQLVKTGHTQTDKATTNQHKAKSLSDIYVPNPQVTDDTKLLKIGQILKDDKGEVTLNGLAALNKSFHIGPIDMKIKNVKLIHNLPTYSLMDYFHYYTEHYEEFEFVKVEVELINHSSENVRFGPVSHLTTSNNEEKVFKDDFYIEYLGGEIVANSSKQGALGFIVEKTSPRLNWLEITTSDVLDDNQKVIQKGQRIKVDF